MGERTRIYWKRKTSAPEPNHVEDNHRRKALDELDVNDEGHFEEPESIAETEKTDSYDKLGEEEEKRDVGAIQDPFVSAEMR